MSSEPREITEEHIKRAADQVYLESAYSLLMRRYEALSWWRHAYRKFNLLQTMGGLRWEYRKT